MRSSSLQSSAKQGRDYRLANIGVGSIDLKQLQVPPKHLTRQSRRGKEGRNHVDPMEEVGYLVPAKTLGRPRKASMFKGQTSPSIHCMHNAYSVLNLVEADSSEW